jgi:N-acetylneuraminate synthase
MKKNIKIEEYLVGDNEPCFVIAEIGINHNGSVEIAKKLIDISVLAGAQAVKFQKRTVDIVYSKDELLKPRDSVFGKTNGDLKRGLEFGKKEYDIIDKHCKEKNILWTASCWDENSLEFIMQYEPKFLKIASASLTDKSLLVGHKSKNLPTILSTGMSTIEEIEKAVDILERKNLILLHCTSSYPCKIEELNLKTISTLIKKFNLLVGYSGHEVGLSTTISAVTLGACVVERHITLDRSMWGSDQSASVEPIGFKKLVTDIRSTEQALGNGIKTVYDSEKDIIKKLRRISDL